MFVCNNCQKNDDLMPVEAGYNYCMKCGTPLQREMVRWTGPIWDPAMPEATNINWLAQAKRRLNYPIDSTERKPMAALEYVWKVFNNLYDPNNDLNTSAAEKMRQCLELYLDAPAFVAETRSKIEELCTYVFAGPYYLPGDRHFTVDFSDEPALRGQELLQRARGHCRKIRDHLQSGNAREAGLSLAKAIYILRNARVHGDPGTGTQRREEAAIGPVDVDLRIVVDLLFELVSHLLKKKANLNHLHDYIESRAVMLVAQIENSVYGWSDGYKNKFTDWAAWLRQDTAK